ncbi:hypothetical protein [Streptomyces oceani]|uniref:hypothetical protein n=1 Tax=Streptomyces oceani TaxID=1075402 RepID=UPI001112E5AA|nr:hypothetical protein [Streptomyces oceani]
MTSSDSQLAEFERVYSAAARMLWAQENTSWRDDSAGWPEQRRHAFLTLEEQLKDAAPEPALPGDPIDPARHLISRHASGADNRPLAFSEAVTEWRERLNEDPGFLVPLRKPFPDYYMEPGSCVIIPYGTHLSMTGVFPEIFHRLAPGRPPLTMGQGGAELSEVAHQAAQSLRAPLGIPAAATPTSQQICGDIRWATQITHIETRLDRLKQAAWVAIETLPTPEEHKRNPDFSLQMGMLRTGVNLRRLLHGEPVHAWQETYEHIDPTEDRTPSVFDDGTGKKRAIPLREMSKQWNEGFSRNPQPWTPKTYQRQYDPNRGESQVVLSRANALVFSEILVEYSARIYPTRHTGLVHFDAIELGQFIKWEFGRSIRSHVGF